MGVIIWLRIPRAYTYSVLVLVLIVVTWFFLLGTAARVLQSSFSNDISQGLARVLYEQTGLTAMVSKPDIEAVHSGIIVTFSNFALLADERKIVNVKKATIMIAPLAFIVKESILSVHLSGSQLQLFRSDENTLHIQNYFTVDLSGSGESSLSFLGSVPYEISVTDISIEYHDAFLGIQQKFIPQKLKLKNQQSLVQLYAASSLPPQWGEHATVSLVLEKTDLTLRNITMVAKDIQPETFIHHVSDQIVLPAGSPLVSIALFATHYHDTLLASGDFSVSGLEDNTSASGAFRFTKQQDSYTVSFPSLAVYHKNSLGIEFLDLMLDVACCGEGGVIPNRLSVRSLEAHQFQLLPFLNTYEESWIQSVKNLYFEGQARNLVIEFEDGLQGRLAVTGNVHITSLEIPEYYYLTGIKIQFTSILGNTRAVFSGSDVHVEVFQLFPRNHYAQEVNGTMHITSTPGKLRLVSEPITIIKDEYQVQTLMDITFETGLSPYVRLQLYADKFDSLTGISMAPTDILNPQLTTWLNTAIKGGNAERFTLRYAGNLYYSLPSAGPEILDIDFNYSNTSLKYQPEWPILQNMSGVFHFTDNQLSVSVTDASYQEMRAQGTLEINDFKNIEIQATLLITGDATSTKNFIVQSPLRKTLGNFMGVSEMQGTLRALISFSIPLESTDTDNLAIAGIVAPKLSRYQISGSHIALDNVSGLLYFTDSSVYSPEINASFNERPFQGTLSTDDNKTIHLQAHTHSDLGALTGLADLTDTFGAQGTAKFNVHGSFPIAPSEDNKTRVKISSDLYGITIAQNNQLGKKSSEKAPTDVSIVLTEKMLQISTVIRNRLSSKFIFMKNGNKFELAGGSAALGATARLAATKLGVLQVSLETSSFVVDKWIPYSIALAKKSKEALPLEIALRADKLFYKQYAINQTTLQVSSLSPTSTNITVTSAEADGTITLSDSDPKLVFAIDRVILGARNFIGTLGRNPINPVQLPRFQLTCKICQFKNRIVKNIAVHNIPTGNGMLFIFNSKIDSTEYSGRLTWQIDSQVSTSYTESQISITTDDFGSLVDDIGYPNIMNEGSGTANLYLTWSAPPYAMDRNTLNGTAQFDLANGTLTSIPQNEAQQVLSIINIAQLPRRLIFDFEDLVGSDDTETKFSEIKSKFILEQGIATTTETTIKGSFGSIALEGGLDFIATEYRLGATVIPKISGALPIISGMLGGLPLLLGSLVLNQTTEDGAGLDKIGSKRYTIRGPFNNPEIKEEVK